MTQHVHGLLRAGDPNLWAEVEGEGDAVLCISGLGYSKWCWDELRDALATQYRVVTFDNRGTGRSDKPAGPYSISMLADDAARVLDALHVERAHVIGHSMGGYITQNLALRHPARVRSVTLAGTSPGGPATEPFPEETARAWREAAHLPPLDYARKTMPISFAPGWAEAHPQQLESYLQRRLQFPTPAVCWQAQYAACTGHAQNGERVENIKVPALVIHGEQDRVVPFANGRQLAQRIAGSQWLPMPGVGHVPYLERREEFTAVVRAHLAGVGA